MSRERNPSVPFSPPDLQIGANAVEYVHADDLQAVQGSLRSILHAPPTAPACGARRIRPREGACAHLTGSPRRVRPDALGAETRFRNPGISAPPPRGRGAE